MPWYIVMTNARSEWMVHKRLRQQGYETLYLHRRETVRHARRKIAVLRPLYPRYVFVSVEPDQSFYAVNTTPGVATVIRGVDGPKIVSDEQIAQERARGDADGLVGPPLPPPPRELLDPGEVVWLTEGAWTGHRGVVVLDRVCEIDLDVALFGRDTRVIAPAEWVSLVSPEVRSHRKIRR